MSPKSPEAPLAVIVFDLPALRVCGLNAVAQALIGLDEGQVLGRFASDLFLAVNDGSTEAVIAALTSGELDCYKARRVLRAPGGDIDVVLWVRRVQTDRTAVVVALVAPADQERPDLLRQPIVGEVEALDAVLAAAAEGPGPTVSDSDSPSQGEYVQRLRLLEEQILEIAATVRSTGNGERRVRKDVHAPGELGALPPRQRDILTRLLAGDRVSMIAAALHLSESTVRNHLSRLYRRYGVRSQVELLAKLKRD